MAQAQAQFEWRDGSENVRSLSDLQEILRKHREWIESEGRSGTQADLNDADLSGADLIDTNLRGAYLQDANLRGAQLRNADPRDANLRNAKLRNADLNSAELSKAYVGRVVFEPTSIPKLRGVAAAKNLELLTYRANPDALVQLRKQFEDGGFREQERKITYALKRRHAELSCHRCKRMLLTDCGSFVFNTVFLIGPVDMG